MVYEATNEGVAVEDADVELDITVRGDEKDAEKVLIHAPALKRSALCGRFGTTNTLTTWTTTR